MSTTQIEPTAPRSSPQLVSVDDFPIGLIDIGKSAPPTESVSDTDVVLLRPEQGPPAAVLKVARGLLGAAELRTQRRVLAHLAIHEGLEDGWRELLPRILAFDEGIDATVSVESYRPGIDLAEVLARHPKRVEELTAAALNAIAPLHRQTATFVVVDNVCLLRRWVIEPLAGLTDICRRLDPRLVPEVDWLGKTLRQALVGWRMPVCWTHGDYTPGAVQVAGMRGPVTGIVDWGRARPGQPALIDEYLIILTVSAQIEHTPIGTIVAERLRAGGLSGWERNALRAARDRLDTRIGDRDRIEDRVAILMTWLHHFADSWRKRATSSHSHIWWAANVAPVLDVVAAWHASEVPSARTRAGRGAASGAPVTPSVAAADSPQAVETKPMADLANEQRMLIEQAQPDGLADAGAGHSRGSPERDVRVQ